MKMVRFRFKLTIAFIIFALAVLIPTVYLIYETSAKRQTRDLKDRILGIVRLSSAGIDADKVSRIRPVPESKESRDYQEVKRSLQELRNSDPLIDSIYLMVKSEDDDVLLFLVDSGDKRKVSADCGEKYDISGIEEMREAFISPRVDKNFTKDKWGTFLSGYAPIYNKDKEPIAIICADVRAESVVAMQLSLAKRFGFIFLLGIVLSLALGFVWARNLTNPLRELTLGVKEVGMGKLDKKVSVNTKDELEELAHAFNRMIDDLKASRSKLERYYLDTISSLARIIEAKDPYTKGHSERVARYAVELAKFMGLPETDIQLLHEAALLHDIGKIGVHDGILTKPSSLNEEEREEVRTHPQVGEDILKFFEFLRPGLSVIRDHHERPDGKGYPRGLAAGQISKIASIVAVVDSFDAMTSNRSYRKAFGLDEAVRRLKEGRGTQFDAQVCDAFILLLKENPFNLS